MSWQIVDRVDSFCVGYSENRPLSFPGEIISIGAKLNVTKKAYIYIENFENGMGWVGEFPIIDCGNFWNNTVIWLSQNVICTTVGSAVYFNDIGTGSLVHIADFSQDIYIETLVCDKETNCLLIGTANSLYIYDSVKNPKQVCRDIATDGVQIINCLNSVVKLRVLDPPNDSLLEVKIKE